jgi:lysophospholipase L1-like esterase
VRRDGTTAMSSNPYARRPLLPIPISTSAINPGCRSWVRQPDLVTVAIGGNDVRAYDADRFAADSAALADALPAGSYVADVPYFMHGRWKSDADEAARTLTDDANDNGLRVVPLHEALRDEGWGAMFTQFAAAWFHPNDQGHRVWAAAFWDAIAAGAAPVA